MTDTPACPHARRHTTPLAFAEASGSGSSHSRFRKPPRPRLLHRLLPDSLTSVETSAQRRRRPPDDVDADDDAPMPTRRFGPTIHNSTGHIFIPRPAMLTLIPTRPARWLPQTPRPSGPADQSTTQAMPTSRRHVAKRRHTLTPKCRYPLVGRHFEDRRYGSGTGHMRCPVDDTRLLASGLRTAGVSQAQAMHARHQAGRTRPPLGGLYGSAPRPDSDM